MGWGAVKKSGTVVAPVQAGSYRSRALGAGPVFMKEILTRNLKVSGIAASQVGMGCASLGSRVAPSAGLRALAEAHDHGVTWFDVAPAYGAGRAEGLLGEFARGRRDRISICTKVGIAPPEHNGLMRVAYGVARPLLGVAKGLRKRARGMKMTRNVHIPLTPELVTVSLERSLRALGTDYIDLFALHDPLPADTRRDDILAALEAAVTAGKVRALSCAGGFEAAETALQEPSPFRVAQFADPPGQDVAARLRARRSDGFDAITHSVLGVGGASEALTAALSANPELAQQLAAGGIVGLGNEMVTEALLRRALTLNSDGVVLLSMFGRGHLTKALAAVAAPSLEANTLAVINSLGTTESDQ
jgi:aryl-alcohol dehydrogenase-like predicted oxidoreductase